MVKPASKKLQAVRVLLLLVFLAFGVVAVLWGAWLFAFVMLVGCGGAAGALVKGQSP